MKPRKILSPNEQKLRSLYDAIRDYREPKSERQLSLIFMKLPSKNVSLQNFSKFYLNWIYFSKFYDYFLFFNSNYKK